MSALEKEASAPAAPVAASDKASAAPGRATLGVDGADGLAGDGLPYKQQSLFQSSLGTDLSAVRVHTGPDAAKQADAMGARAFAKGNDIVFGEGQYNPNTPEGDRLLAHEVAHTVQQRGADPKAGPLKTTTPGDTAEKGADNAAAAMVDGAPAAVQAEPTAIALKGRNEDVAPEAAPAGEAPAGEAPIGPEAKAEGEGTEKEGEEEIGELSVERVGSEEYEGEDQEVGPPQNLEAGKQFLASKGGGEAEGGESEGVEGGGSEAPQPQSAPAGDGGGELPPEMQAHLAEVQAEVQASTESAQAEADAFKAESRARQDRFDNEQTAVATERLQSMSAAEKRSTLIEMGADAKTVKKMKDAELDGIISGKLETEQRRTKIMGMDEKELAALSPASKSQFLVDMGVEKKDLDKIGPQKAAKAFDDVMRVAHVPGKHKVKVKIKGGLLAKSWEISVNVDADGNPDFEAKKKGGFLSKLWGWVKLALPVIAIVLAPVTGGVSLLLLSVYQTVSAIAQGDWLGAIIGAAGAIAGLGAIKAAGAIAQGAAQGAVQGAAGMAQGAVTGAAKFAASGLGKISSIALKVQKAAQAAKATMAAAKAKSPGSLLSALADGASTFAGFSSDKAGAFAKKMTDWSKRLEKWSNVVQGGEKVIAGVKNKDPGAALSGAFDAASAYVSNKDENGTETSQKAKDFQRYSRMSGYVSAGQSAAKGSPPNYGGVVEAAMGLATELKTKGGKTPKALEDANRIVSSASRLTSAVQANNPEAIAEAALGLAQTIQTAKYDDPDPNPNAKDSDGDGMSDDRERVMDRYAKASSIITFAGDAVRAASAKPRPNYIAALSAGTQLIADLTDNKRMDQANEIQQKLDGFTAAVKTKNNDAIFQAGIAFGESIEGMRSLLEQERADAKKAAEAKLAAGETLEEKGGSFPKMDTTVGLPDGAQIGEKVDLPAPPAGAEGGATVTTSEEFKGVVPNYSIVPGDTLGGIAQRFDTSVSTLMSANPGINPNRLQIGQRIYVPGAEKVLTPNVTTTETYRVGGDEDKDKNGDGWNVTVPPTGAAPDLPDSGNKAFELPLDLQTTLDIAKIMVDLGAYFGHPGIQKSIAMWKSLVNQHTTAKDQKNPSLWRNVVAGLESLKTFEDFKQAWSTEFDALGKFFGNAGDDTAEAKAAARAGLQAVRRYKANISRVIRAGNIFGTFSSAAGHVVVAAGYKEDGTEATTLERAEAARALGAELMQLRKDIPWALAMIGKIGRLAGAGQAVEGWAIVRRAVNRFGDDVGGVVMKWVNPVLEKMAKQKGTQWATEAAGRVAAELAGWGGLAADVAGSQVGKTIGNQLAKRLGSALKWGLSPQFAIAFEIAKLELEFAADLWDKCFNSLNVILSQKLYGSMIQMKKAEIRSQSTESIEAANATIRYAYRAFANAEKSWVRLGWPAYVQTELARHGKWYAREASSAETLLSRLEQYWTTKQQDARLIQTILLQYVDFTFKKEFNVDPPA